MNESYLMPRDDLTIEAVEVRLVKTAKHPTIGVAEYKRRPQSKPASSF